MATAGPGSTLLPATPLPAVPPAMPAPAAAVAPPLAAPPQPVYLARPRSAFGYREGGMGVGGYPGAAYGAGYGGAYGQAYYDPRVAGQAAGYGYGQPGGVQAVGGGAGMGVGYGAGGPYGTMGAGGGAMGMGGGAMGGGVGYDPSLGQRLAGECSEPDWGTECRLIAHTGDIGMVVGYSRGDPAMMARGQQKRVRVSWLPRESGTD